MSLAPEVQLCHGGDGGDGENEEPGAASVQEDGPGPPAPLHPDHGRLGQQSGLPAETHVRATPLRLSSDGETLCAPLTLYSYSVLSLFLSLFALASYPTPHTHTHTHVYTHLHNHTHTQCMCPQRKQRLHSTPSRGLSRHVLCVGRDSVLLKSGSWSKKVEVVRCSKGEEISVNLISSQYGTAENHCQHGDPCHYHKGGAFTVILLIRILDLKVLFT